MPPISNEVKQYEASLRDTALGFPGAYEEFPWGHRALKVNKKAFAFLVADEKGLSLSLKLPVSNAMALMMPFATPTGYGLGKSGWVSASFGPRDTPPLSLLGQWLEESYRAIAPKKLVAQLAGGARAPAEGAAPRKSRSAPAVKKPAAKKSAVKKPAAKKPAARPRSRSA
jgi:predicted DNA-binding protein (MmcQ/YjbR family)